MFTTFTLGEKGLNDQGFNVARVIIQMLVEKLGGFSWPDSRCKKMSKSQKHQTALRLDFNHLTPTVGSRRAAANRNVCFSNLNRVLDSESGSTPSFSCIHCF